MTGRQARSGDRSGQADNPGPRASADRAAQPPPGPAAEVAGGSTASAVAGDFAASNSAGGTTAQAPGSGATASPDAADSEAEAAAARDNPGDGRGAGDVANGVPSRRRAAVPRLPEEPPVPLLLQRAAAWSWRLLLVALLIYVAFRVATALALVVLPCIAALLLTALLEPLTSRLRRTGMPSLAATWCTILAAVIVLAGIVTLAATRVRAEYPKLQKEVKHTAKQVQNSLAGSPFHLTNVRLEQYTDQFTHYLSQHQSLIAGTVLTGGKIVIELATGLVLMLFVTFFLLKDGNKIWNWLIKALPADARLRADNAGAAAWTALVNYVRGTTAVAAIHAIVIGLSLWLLGVPLLVPLIILVFIAAFVPLIGILVAGALAIVVTLGTRGWIAAVILLGIFLLENQLEGHLLQPQVVGRIVRLHPLAIILVLAVGAIIAGVAGAIVAVPAAAALCYAWPHLRRDRPPPESPPPPGLPPGQ
jgi:predicted PurR-regulated permease PerM